MCAASISRPGTVVPLSRASLRIRVAATLRARSMQFRTVLALEKYGNSLRMFINSVNFALAASEYL